MATLTVTTNADSGTGSLRQAIADAVSGDTITFAAALSGTTITLSSTITLGGKILIINGLTDANGDPAITISGNNTARIFGTTVNPTGQSSNATLNNLILKNGYTNNTGGGGAILINQGCKITAFNCQFVDNVSSYSGGAIANSFGQVFFTNCVFDGNTANSGNGGGCSAVSNASFFSCIFKNNASTTGGSALHCGGDSLLLENCVFENNTSSQNTSVDISVISSSQYANPSKPTLTLNGVNTVSFQATGNSYKNVTINVSGYNGIKYLELSSYCTITGSGFLALPSSASVTLPSTVTRTVYGAGISNFTAGDATLKWDSTDSTKSVLLEIQNGANWDAISTSATSPQTGTLGETYRIWDGATFLTATAVVLPPQTLVVTNTNDSGSGSLRAALASARAVDTVTFDASLSGSTITLASGLTLSDDVVIVGLTDANGDPAITISGANTYRILSGDYQMTLSNLIFANAGDHAIYNEDANGSTFTNCAFSNNSATDSYGGAVLLTGNDPTTESVTFTDCVFTGNESLKSSALGFGGALTTQNLSATITGCTFTGNKAYGGYGGALALFSPAASYTLTDCEFTGNSIPTKSASTYMSDQGGAVYIVGTSTFTRCSFTSNSTEDAYDGDQGGAVYVGNNSSFTDCTFSGNSVAHDGGALYADDAVVTLSGCTFSSNTATNGADYYGGTSSDLAVPSGIVTIPNVYIKSDAEASIADGAALSVSNSATILGSVSATTRGYLATPPGTDLTGATLTHIVACDYGAGVSAFAIDEDSADWTAAHSNISVLLEKKVNNAWQTLAQPTGTSYSTTFSDGDEARIFDGIQFMSDMAVVPQTLIVTNTNNSGEGSLRAAVAAARAIDTITFDSALAGETISLSSGMNVTNGATIVGLVDADGKPDVTVDGSPDVEIFNVVNPLIVSNVNFRNGNMVAYTTGAFDGSSFTNCTFSGFATNVLQYGNSGGTDEELTLVNCVFDDNDLADVALYGAASLTLAGDNVLTEGIDASAGGTVGLANAGYNGVGAYTAPSSGTATLTGSGNIALPNNSGLTVPNTIVESEFGAGVSAISASDSEISWTATDSTKSVLLEKQNGASWDVVDDDATSPATVSASGTYRVWDGVAFFSTSVEPEPAIAIRPGRRVCRSLQFDYTNEGAETIDAGTAIKIGSAFGVIETAILPGATGTVTTLGTWFIPCLDTTVADFGAVAYWDDENQRVTSNDSGTMRIGLFVKPVTSGEEEATVMIFPVLQS